jgi:hypothetical protein
MAAMAATSFAQCASWRPGFDAAGIGGYVNASVSFDDGSGPAVYVGGGLFTVGPSSGLSVARWDGANWSDVGGGIPGGDVKALHVFDDGSGPALFVGGSFTTAGGTTVSNLAKWNGTTWTNVGGGVSGWVTALGSFDDGTGPALYVGGPFGAAGGVAAVYIARWNGTSWSPVGGNLTGSPNAFTVYDDGSGSALYAGGWFTSAGGTSANHIAKWDGAVWSPLSSGTSGEVFTLASYDDGTGPALFAGGVFVSAGATSAIGIARWDGASWSSVGSTNNAGVYSLAVHDDGTGSALYAGGGFTSIGGTSANHVARWNGASWSNAGSGVSNNGLGTLLVHDDGGGSALYGTGGFTSSGGGVTNGLGKWNGTTWSALQTAGGFNGTVQALFAYDDGSGPALYAGGGFTQAGATLASRIAKFDGTSWSPIGSNININGSVMCFATFDDGTGTALYAGGFIDPPIAGTTSREIARWDGVSWSSLSTGMNTTVNCLAVFDDGSGPALYAGGLFTTAGGIPASRIAKWNGASWSTLGSGMDGPPYVQVHALATFDDGSGPALYAGGYFTSAGGVIGTAYVARWDGAAWSSVGGGMNEAVYALEVFDDGSGPALYAGGNFTSAGGTAAARIARWNGTTWSAVGAGMNSAVHALEPYDGGFGPALLAGGLFTVADGSAAIGVARWNGASWAGLGAGVGSSVGGGVFALAGFDDGSDGAADLYAAGSFNTAGGIPSINIAEWFGCPFATAYCFGDGSGTACPCGNDSPAGGQAGCLSSVLTGGKLTGSGAPSLSADGLHLNGSQMPNSSVLYFQGTTQVAGGAGAAFGDGLRCAGGSVIRMGTVMNTGGASIFPSAGGVPISVKGHVLAPGTREYQAWYRNSAPFCTSAVFNSTNAVRVSWVP